MRWNIENVSLLLRWRCAKGLDCCNDSTVGWLREMDRSFEVCSDLLDSPVLGSVVCRLDLVKKKII